MPTSCPVCQAPSAPNPSRYHAALNPLCSQHRDKVMTHLRGFRRSENPPPTPAQALQWVKANPTLWVCRGEDAKVSRQGTRRPKVASSRRVPATPAQGVVYSMEHALQPFRVLRDTFSTLHAIFRT